MSEPTWIEIASSTGERRSFTDESARLRFKLLKLAIPVDGDLSKVSHARGWFRPFHGEICQAANANGTWGLTRK
ncbi:MAG TPA: hypothetical protein VJ180_09085 [Pyrinomonadaceae bacterium]|nr:hypothetical protein [Pyrinomonadaceae bacterium]